MRKIEAIIKQEKLEDVKEALKTIELKGLSISQIMGYGFTTKIMLEMFAFDELADEVADLIRDVANIGDGSGKIIISEVLDVFQVRNGKRMLAAVS